MPFPSREAASRLVAFLSRTCGWVVVLGHDPLGLGFYRVTLDLSCPSFDRRPFLLRWDGFRYPLSLSRISFWIGHRPGWARTASTLSWSDHRAHSHTFGGGHDVGPVGDSVGSIHADRTVHESMPIIWNHGSRREGMPIGDIRQGWRRMDRALADG